MSDEKEIYVDGIGKVHFVGGMVRIDMVTLKPNEDGASREPVSEFKQRIIIPPNGLLGMYNTIKQFIDQLVDAGVLRKTKKAPAPRKKLH